MKKKIVNFFLMAVMFIAVMGTTVSCKDYDEDMYSDMQGQLNAQTTALQNALSALQTEQEYLSSIVTDNTTQIAALQEAQGTLQDAIDKINTTLSSGGGIEGMFTWAEIAGMWKAYSELVQYVGGDADKLVSMQKELLDFCNELDAAGMSYSELIEQATYAYEKAQYIDDLVLDVETLKSKVADLESLKEDVETAIDNYGTLQDAIQKVIGNGTYSSLEELENALGSQIGDLDSRVTALEEALANISIGGLTELQSCLNQLVTSIIVQGSYNPVFGTLSLPVGIQSNVLAAYYGTAETDLEFPTARGAYYTTGDSGLTTEDINMLNATSEKISGTLLLGQGNAGTLYVTVNPNTVDYTGVNFTLENSVGEAAGITLDGLTPSDTKLGFGYTRSTDNGFYETTATVSEDALESVTPRISLSDLKGVVSELKNYVTSKGSSGINVTSILTTLYANCSDVLDANAVCAAWTDANGDDHKTYSNYEVAATAINPLSYAFLQDADYSSVPGLGTIENYINKFFNKITIPSFDLSQYSFSKIDTIKFEGDGIISTDITVHFTEGDVLDQTVDVYDSNGNVIGSAEVKNGDKDVTVHVEIDLKEFTENEYGEINQVINEINSYLDDVNDVLDALSDINDLSDAIDDLQSKLLSYLDKLNTKLCSFINSANKALQPILLVNTTDEFGILSQMQSQPSVLSSGDNIVLVPTSYTFELLAPAYKKLVGVTNVYNINDLSVSAQGGDSSCLSALQAANGNDDIDTVLDGNTKQVSMSGLKSGYIYEIAFTAVDYNGKVVAEKYYVCVK